MITIVLPISRKDYLLPIFDCLDKLKRPNDTELLLITDGDAELEKAVQLLLDSISYFKVMIVNFGDAPAAEIVDRRKRIAEIHNFAKQYISEDCKQVFLIEDDTVFDELALSELQVAMFNEKATFVQGVEVGRWKTPYIGGWLADDFMNPKVIKSVKPSKGLQEIDAGGLYCALVDAKAYLQHHFQPYASQDMKGLGCDVNFGLWMRKLGMKVVMDWDVQCGHYKDGRQLRLEEIRPVVAVFELNDNNKWLATNHWADEEKS